MTTVSKPQQNFVKFIACLGFCEGLVGFILSCTNVTLYFIDSPPENLLETKLHRFNYVLYIGNLYNYDVPPTYILTPELLTTFMLVYLIIYISWVLVSTKLFGSLRHKNYFFKYLRIWGLIAALVSCVDVLLYFLVKTDYKHNCNLTYTQTETDLQVLGMKIVCANGFASFLHVIVKFYVVWILNVVLAALIYKNNQTI